LHRRTTNPRVSAKFLHRPARSLRRPISLLSTFGAVAGVQLQTSRSIKPRERDLGDLRLFVLVRILTRPTNHPRHAACVSNDESKPVRPRFFEDFQFTVLHDFCNVALRKGARCEEVWDASERHPYRVGRGGLIVAAERVNCSSLIDSPQKSARPGNRPAGSVCKSSKWTCR
jgi:hypothetical protein